MVKKQHERVTKDKNAATQTNSKKAEAGINPVPELNELIGFENLLPKNFDFYAGRDFKKLKARLPKKLQEIISDEHDNYFGEMERYKSLAETISTLRKCAEYFMDEIPYVDGSAAKLQIFVSLIPARKNLKRKDNKESHNSGINSGLIRQHKMFEPINSQFEQTSVWRENIKLPLFLVAPKVESNFQVDYQSTYLMEVLQGIDARRLRICSNEKCSHVFWAYRLNQRFCGETCQNKAKRNRSYHKNKKKGGNKNATL